VGKKFTGEAPKKFESLTKMEFPNPSEKIIQLKKEKCITKVKKVFVKVK